MKLQVKNMLGRAIMQLEETIALNDSNSNMHYYLGILKTIAGQPSEAVQCFANAIDKSDDNYYNHYYWKGIALANADCYDLAISELDIAKNIDKSKTEASLHIGICYLIVGDLDNAYDAFKSVVGCPDNELEVNYCIGKFFMSRGFMQHAIQSFQFALKNKPTERVLQELLKCFIHEKNLVSAMDTLRRLDEVTTRYRTQYAFDIGVLDSLKLCCEGSDVPALDKLVSLEQGKREGFIFKKFDLLVYQAVVAFMIEDYQKSLKTMTLMEMEYYSKSGDTVPSEQEEDCFNVLFMEPTDREGQYYTPTKSVTHPELIYNMALCQLMLKNYDRAYMKLASLVHIPQIGLKVIRLMAKIKRHVSADSLTKAKTLATLNSAKNSEGSEDGDIFSQLLMESPDKIDLDMTDVCPFPTENRLCSIYSGNELEISEDNTIELRMSFCLSAIEISSIQIRVSYEELLKINLRSIEYRPEAPWIKKLDDRIIFTNHLVQDEVTEFESPDELVQKLKLQSQLSVNTLIKINIDQAYHHNLEVQRAAALKKIDHDDHDDEYDSLDDNYHDDDDDDGKPDLAKLKKELMLDDRTNELLSKLGK